jgi:hypothetical protein
MRAVAGQGRRGSGRWVWGRWVWGLSGLVTAAALAIPGARLITSPGTPANAYARPLHVVTVTGTVPQPVTSVLVQSYGGRVQVTSGQVNRVRVTETIAYDKGPDSAPVVQRSVSGGRLSLSDPACNQSDCTVDFDVTVPPGVTVTASTEGGPLAVSGTAGATLDSGGGPVQAALIAGPLTVNTAGGPLSLRGVSGPLHAETDGGTLLGQDIASATATITTGGGDAVVTFAAAPQNVSVSSDGGLAIVAVPGGPYRLTADSDGGPQSVDIATDPTALPSITIYSGGGPLRVRSTGST